MTTAATPEEIQSDLRRIEFPPIASGETLRVWSRRFPGGSENVLSVRVDGEKDLEAQIMDELTRDLESFDPDDAATFYLLLSALVTIEDDPHRLALVDYFEGGGAVQPLWLLRVGKGYSPRVDCVHRRDGEYYLRWSN
jgi:hypothetical protein